MNESVREWLVKASNGLRSAQREMQLGYGAHFDLVCFLCQQCAEKLFKGALAARRIVPPKTHDLVELHRLLKSVEPTRHWDEMELRPVNVGAVIYRYPGQWAEREIAESSLSFAERIQQAVTPLLDLPSGPP
jgi:HEPN domain-containing protein